ncbi:MAG: 1,2-phenylacetyl-CoA epoxidase subunit PaaD [Candidatus Limnocylindria bacterium]
MVIEALPSGSARVEEVWRALADVADPEIPSVSVIDLGIVRRVEFVGEDASRLEVEIMPTFVGCPAVDVMRAAIGERLSPFAGEVDVSVTFAEPWTAARITPDGRRKLRESGFAPPSAAAAMPEGQLLQVLPSFTLPVAECPYCGSRRTTLENAFGPTLCRSIYHCGDCRQPFEQFKTV